MRYYPHFANKRKWVQKGSFAQGCVATKWLNHTPLPPSWWPVTGLCYSQEMDPLLSKEALALQGHRLQGLQDAAVPPPLRLLPSSFVAPGDCLLSSSHGPVLGSSLWLDSSSHSCPSDIDLLFQACSSLQVFLRHHLREAFLTTRITTAAPASPPPLPYLYSHVPTTF